MFSKRPTALLLLLLSLCIIPGFSLQAQVALVDERDVFTSGTDGYAVFRIPSIVVTSGGTLLAFAEGRRDGGGDAGKIDTVLRRSTDGGQTWGALQVVWSDGDHTCGNPAPVVDARTGRVILVNTWNRGDDHEKDIMAGTSKDTRRVFVSYSSDDGLTWTGRKEITDAVKKPHWRWYATGPCHGIQLASGRLVIPANHSDHSNPDRHPYSAHVIYSDDGGDTWKLGGSPGDHTNESCVTELTDGRLMLNMRSYHGVNRRAVAWSKDAGDTWDGVYLQPELVEPVCQASLLRVTGADDKALYVFSNPASAKREKLTVRLSRDECRTWDAGLLLHPGFSAYSDLCPLPGGQVGCLYERDQNGQNYGRITFARLSVK